MQYSKGLAQHKRRLPETQDSIDEPPGNGELKG